MMRRREPNSAELNEKVLRYLSPGQYVPSHVDQRAAQHFAWYIAPFEWRLPGDELTEVAETCASVLESSGRRRAGTYLRVHTPEVLAAWGRSQRDGRVACATAMRDSGVEPPSTPTVTWSATMGRQEAAVFKTAGRMLELAIDAGSFRPGNIQWRKRQHAALRAWLSAPSTLFNGSTPTQVVHSERRIAWVQNGSPARRAMLHWLLPVLAAPAVVGPQAAVAPEWFDLDELPAQLVEISAAVLLKVPAGIEVLLDAAYDVLVAECRLSGCEEPRRTDARFELAAWLRYGHRRGWLTYADGRLHQFTDIGRAAALHGLRYRAHRPIPAIVFL